MAFSSNAVRGLIDNGPLSRLTPDITLKLILLILGLGLSLVAAYLIPSGGWPIALGLVLALPGLILLHNYPLIGLFVWLMLAPLLMVADSTSLRRLYWIVHRILPLLTIFVIVLGSMLRVNKRKLPKLGWIELAMLGYVGISLASIAFLNADPITTVIWYYDRVIVPMFLYLLVRLLVPNQEELRRLLPALFFLCLTQAIFGVIYVVSRNLLPSSWLRATGARATGSLGSPSVYSIAVIFAAILLLHAALSLKSQGINRFKLPLIGVFVLAMMAVFFTFSRSSWMSGVIVIVGFLFIYPKFTFRIALIATPVVFLVAGGLLVSQLSYASDRLYSEQSSESALSRLPVVVASLRMFEAKPVFGWGYSNFDNFDRQFQERVGDLVSPDKDHASHNLYLTILAEQGLMGLLLYLAPVFGLLFLSIKKWPDLAPQGFWSRKLLLILWVGVATHIIVNNFSNMRVVFGLGLWWITLGLIAAVVSNVNQPAKNETSAVQSGKKSE